MAFNAQLFVAGFHHHGFMKKHKDFIR